MNESEGEDEGVYLKLSQATLRRKGRQSGHVSQGQPLALALALALAHALTGLHSESVS